jgi:hypothetical protein
MISCGATGMMMPMPIESMNSASMMTGSMRRRGSSVRPVRAPAAVALTRAAPSRRAAY